MAGRPYRRRFGRIGVRRSILAIFAALNAPVLSDCSTPVSFRNQSRRAGLGHKCRGCTETLDNRRSNKARGFGKPFFKMSPRADDSPLLKRDRSKRGDGSADFFLRYERRRSPEGQGWN
jgi:hypothetical protein